MSSENGAREGYEEAQGYVLRKIQSINTTDKSQAPVPDTDDPQPKKSKTTKVQVNKTATKPAATETKKTVKKATKPSAAEPTATETKQVVKKVTKPTAAEPSVTETKQAVKKATKPATKAKAPNPAPAPIEEDALAGFGSDSDADSLPSAADQSAALAGFSPSPTPEPESEIALAALPSIPSPATAALAKSALPRAATPGVIYLSRIPHGFHEAQMRAYFTQFGDVTRLRLARNKRTGRSKHHAWLEFAHAEVAAIAAETMNNYLLFGHLLKVSVVPAEQVHAELFKGSEKRFKKVPWNAIERGRVARTDREGWGKRVGREERRRTKKEDKLRALGYEFAAPGLRSVEDVEVQTPKVKEDEGKEGAESVVKAIEAPKEEERMTVEKIIAKGKEAANEPEKEKVAVKGKKAGGEKKEKAVKMSVKGGEKAVKKAKAKAVKA